MREYAKQLLVVLIKKMERQNDQSLFGRVEFHILKHVIPTVKDEMIYKTVL